MTTACAILSPDADIHLDAVAPYALRYEATSDDAAFDLTTPTAARFEVLKPDGEELTWSATLSDQQTTTATLTHIFAAGELDIPGDYRIEPRMDTPSGEFVAEVKVLRVRQRFS